MLYFFTIFLFLFGSISFYIGLRFKQTFSGIIPNNYEPYYWLFIALLAFSYFLGRLVQRNLPSFFSHAFITLGSYWLGFMYYSILILLAAEVALFMDRMLNIFPAVLGQHPVQVGFSGLAFIGGVLAYGAIKAGRLPLISYEAVIPKKTASLKELRLVVASDLHLGSIINSHRLAKIIDIINAQQPDLVLLPGDIIEEALFFKKENMASVFKKLQSKYGVYAVLGNHEYSGGHLDLSLSLLEAAGITVLRDSYTLVDDMFYIVGRDDHMKEFFSEEPRQQLSKVMYKLDKSLPIILMDHQPRCLVEAQASGADIQISGHTHQGQFFPNNLITRRIFEVDHGHLEKEDFHVIVTSGAGTWGPPLRIGTSSEIVKLKLQFK